MIHSIGDNRSVELSRCKTRELFGWLTIRADGKAAVYEVENGEGPLIWLIRKVSPVEADEIYEVAIAGPRTFCNCKGSQVRKACRHRDAFRRLYELGLLGDVPQAEDIPF